MMRRWISFVRSLLLLTFAAVPGFAGGQVADVTLTQARALLQKQDWVGAATALREITSREESNAQAWFLLGYALHAGGELEQALKVHERAAGFPEVAGTASYNAACACSLLGRTEDALGWLDRARSNGFVNREQVWGDPDLAALRDEPRFAAWRPEAPDSRTPFLEEVTILHDHFGAGANSQFGWVARVVGDVDGDGKEDYAVTAPYAAGSGLVVVYSAGTGAEVFRCTGAAGDEYGWNVAGTGDVDADGFDDVAVGAPGANARTGRVSLLSGKDGSVLRALEGEAGGDRFGEDIALSIDAEGVARLVVGAPRHDAAGVDSGRAYVIPLHGGDPWRHLDGAASGDHFGASVAASTDGSVRRIAVAATDAGGLPRRSGRITVFDPMTLEECARFDGRATSGKLGWFLSFVGDVDGDGCRDLYVTDWHDTNRGNTSGVAYVLSGASGVALRTLEAGVPGEGFGIGVGGAHDLDGDGVPDLVVGAWLNGDVAGQAGKVYVHSGRDASLLGTLTGAIPGDALGFDATLIGDCDGDGVPELLVTSAYNGAGGVKAGRVYVVSGASYRGAHARER